MYSIRINVKFIYFKKNKINGDLIMEKKYIDK